MAKHLETKGDDDIVVFVDGFDTLINKDLAGFEEKFRDTGAGIVVSADPESFGKYVSQNIFGTCDGKHVANTGMYVGYARDIKIVLADALDMSCEDDQVNMNALCSAYDFIQVDDDRVFFENVSPMTDTKNVSSSAYFVSFPGTLEFGRIRRALREYAQFFRVDFVVLALIAIAIAPKRRKPIVVAVVASLVAAYAAFAEKSCVDKA
tara:strand:- start:2051 stop:2671 length:621 start_codon:yes stop_codon:yes gene_type:complete